MTDHTTEVLVGAAVLAAAAGFLIYAGQIAGIASPVSGATIYTASFRSVEGVSVGTDVRLGGVKVGAVNSLTLNPVTFRADASFTIDDALRLPEDSAVVISSEGLLGGKFVELQPGGSPLNLEPGAEIEDTQSSISLTSLLLKFIGGTAKNTVTGQ